jgi:hypothetical protein
VQAVQEKRFERDEAEEIIRHCDSQLTEFIRVDDRGVWPAVDRDGLAKAEYEALAWRPALASKDPLLNVRKIPALPFPFSARQLAAFMMDGAGSMVQAFYGEWEDGPDVDCLEIIPEEFNSVRIALTDAFQAYRDALEIVGSYPLELQERADRLRKIYDYRNRKANTRESVFARDIPGDEEAQRIEVNARRERAIASNSGWSKLYEVTAKECHAAAVDWRAAMVNTLLEPARAQDAATPAPVMAESDAPAQPTGIIHSTKTRRNALTPVIELAQSLCRDRFDDAEVWAVLQTLAEKKEPPLIGATEDGLQYLKDGIVGILTRDALNKRVALKRRQSRLAAVSRR